MLGQRFEETLTVPRGEIPHTNCSNRLVLDVRFPNVFVALHCGRLNVKFISGGNAQPPVQTWKVTPLDELTEGLGASHSILSVHRNENAGDLFVEFLSKPFEVRRGFFVRVFRVRSQCYGSPDTLHFPAYHPIFVISKLPIKSVPTDLSPLVSWSHGPPVMGATMRNINEKQRRPSAS
jgi:hypothetical protein